MIRNALKKATLALLIPIAYFFHLIGLLSLDDRTEDTDENDRITSFEASEPDIIEYRPIEYTLEDAADSPTEYNVYTERRVEIDPADSRSGCVRTTTRRASIFRRNTGRTSTHVARRSTASVRSLVTPCHLSRASVRTGSGIISTAARCVRSKRWATMRRTCQGYCGGYVSLKDSTASIPTAKRSVRLATAAGFASSTTMARRNCLRTPTSSLFFTRHEGSREPVSFEMWCV